MPLCSKCRQVMLGRTSACDREERLSEAEVKLGLQLALAVVGVSLQYLRFKAKDQAHVGPRRKVIFLLYTYGASFPQIGKVIHRDHASVINLWRQAKRQFAAGTDDLVGLKAKFEDRRIEALMARDEADAA